ncbi:MAG: hypothetical protein IJ582_04845 [Prevotella sp.]|nr:hypothetical protein [Prevotella sp.]
MAIRKTITIILLCLIECTSGIYAISKREYNDSLVLNRMFGYKDSQHFEIRDSIINSYTLFTVSTQKKNKLLFTVPSMYVLARRSNTDYAGELYTKITLNSSDEIQTLKQVDVGTVPRHKNTLPTVMNMSMPNLYNVTLFRDHILSPFNAKNQILYRYGISYLTDNRAEVVFRPRKYNTQLVSGKAIIDIETGRIISFDFNGEYDMIRFDMNSTMGEEGFKSLIPKNLNINATFKYLGNVIKSNYHTEFGLPVTLPDSIEGSHEMALMDSLRPAPLPLHIQRLYDIQDSINHSRDTLPPRHKKKSIWKTIFWDAIGDNLVNRIKGNFGSNDQGYFRISPILNPLYFGYNPQKGFTYKSKLRVAYSFSPEKEIYLNARLGYTFKQKQFYFRVPIRYTYNKSRNGYVEVNIGNGNRIKNSTVRDRLKEEGQDSVVWSLTNLDYFKDMYTKITTNYDISDKWSIGGGMTYHRRSAVDGSVFKKADMPSTYYSLAPMIETQIRPWGWKGPIFTINYEQGIGGIGQANMEYGRIEADAIWLRKFNRLRSLSMRLGAGAYTNKGKDCYFLDYENFREDNMPGGWNDDWTGEFQILNRTYYNSSDYYVRANATYESPLMLMSRLPVVGKIMEMERIYVSSLLAHDLYPYTEWGYGFTNRLFSFGLFIATKNAKYDGIGFRVGFELFNDW